MVWLFTAAFRVLLWFLLTSDGSWLNLSIGLALALLLPQSHPAGQRLGPLMQALGRSLVAIPLAFAEAFALISSRGGDEESWIERPSSGSPEPLVIFLEVFAITMTPFTIVLGLSGHGSSSGYRIHQLRPKRRRRQVGPSPSTPTDFR